MDVYASISEQAIEARNHLTAAIENLDEIIRLAQAAGNKPVENAARTAKKDATASAKTFNNKVAGDDGHIDPIAVEQTIEAADKADTDYHRLLRELEKKVDANKAQADAGFSLLGIAFGESASSATVKEGGWMATVNEGLNGHEARIKDLEENVGKRDGDKFVFVDSFRRGGVDDFDIKAFAVYVIIGLVLGLVAGVIFNLLHWGLFGPVGGAFIGAFLGAIAGFFAGSRRKN